MCFPAWRKMKSKAPALGVAWDGTGYGTDGTIWGGEFLLAGEESFRARRASSASSGCREARPRSSSRAAPRSAFFLTCEGEGLFDQSDLAPFRDFSEADLALIRQMLDQGISVAGHFQRGPALRCRRGAHRICGSASLSKARPRWNSNSRSSRASSEYAFRFESRHRAQHHRLAADDRGDPGRRAAGTRHRHHRREISQHAGGNHRRRRAARSAKTKVVLTGGCFQNRYLTERSVQRLLEAGFRPYWHQRVPTNDGGIALGQVMAAELARRNADPHDAGRRRRSHEPGLRRNRRDLLRGRIASWEKSAWAAR